LASTVQLAQERVSGTTAVTIFSPSKRDRYTITSILIANTTTSLVDFRLFHDEDGETYDEGSALFYDIPLSGNCTFLYEVPIYMNNPAGGLGARTETSLALTFTVYGNDGSI
jgi:hypothetical protein